MNLINYKEYKQKPEEIKRRKEYMKEYMQTPEYKAKKKEYDRVYNQQPEVKERRKEYYGRPSYKIRKDT